jgi:hypothetical protein
MSAEPTAEEFDCRANLPQQLHHVAQAILFLAEQNAACIEIGDLVTQFEMWFILVRDSETDI